MFDTHCHLNFHSFKNNVYDVIKRARDIGVSHITIPSTDVNTSIDAVEIAQSNKDIYSAVGIHPHHIFKYQIPHPRHPRENGDLQIPDQVGNDSRAFGNDAFAFINSELKQAQICLIGISNSLTFMDNLDPRVRSSLGEEELIFPPYNALQLQDILKERSNQAFKESILEEGVIAKCAAYAAREHGDARKAIELLRVAGEIAERTNSKLILTEHLDSAEEKLEKEKVFDIVKTQPKQFQAVLLSIINTKGQNPSAYTGEIYDIYRKLCFKTGLRPLTQRRISDIIHEFELMGILSTKTISKGRYGRTRDITLSVSPSAIPMTRKILEDELNPN